MVFDGVCDHKFLTNAEAIKIKWWFYKCDVKRLLFDCMVEGKSGRMYAKATNAETYFMVSETNDFKKINLRWLKKFTMLYIIQTLCKFILKS